MIVAYFFVLLIASVKLRAATSFVFHPQPINRRSAACSRKAHRVLPDAPKTENKTGALSMNIEELAIALGGMGRARIVWDCYAIGVDPQLYYDTGGDAHDDDIQRLLPSSRRTQRLGKEALEKLSNLYGNVGRVEGGVASLSHISTSSDLTTKLLLKLADGLEVETVIIPWSGARSTLCIS